MFLVIITVHVFDISPFLLSFLHFIISHYSKALVKQVKHLEDEKKLLKLEIMNRDKIILQSNKDVKLLQDDQKELIAVIETQKLQLNDW